MIEIENDMGRDVSKNLKLGIKFDTKTRKNKSVLPVAAK